MSDGTSIEWTDATWNPIRGCSRVSEGCRNCYAEKVAARFSGKGLPYEGLTRAGKWNGAVRVVEKAIDQPLRWKRPRKIFVNSMSDLFHDNVSNETIAAIFGVMAAAPQHTFQVLTKRPERMHAWFKWHAEQTTIDGEAWIPLMREAIILLASERGNQLSEDAIARVPGRDEKWPLPNVWLGVSVENQAAADERIPLLLQTPATVRFLSCEPLLGPVDLVGWGDKAPSADWSAVPATWAEFVWPDWIPIETRGHIEKFWSDAFGRSPRSWVRDNIGQRMPATGARITVDVSKHGWATTNKMATEGVEGRYIHLWNNIGKIITADGRSISTGGGYGSGWLSNWLTPRGDYKPMLHWVIAGGESGPAARPMHPRWVQSLRDQCAAADVPFFMKQMGGTRKPFAAIPDDLLIRQFPEVQDASW